MKQRIIINFFLIVNLTGLTLSCTEMPEVVQMPVVTVPINKLDTGPGTRTERGLMFTLESVSFETNSATLSMMSSIQLDDFARIIQQYGNKMIAIEGHTDNTGDASYNLSLSEQRAQAIRDALVARGVNPSRIIIQGFGETRPLTGNFTRTGRQKNRRVEIIILD